MTELTELLEEAWTDWLYPIYVPSYQRASKAPLLNLLAQAPRSVQKLVHIVVRRSEMTLYKKAYPWATLIPQQAVPGIGPARMDAIGHADEQGYERIVMLDDDITKVQLLEYRGLNEQGKPVSGRYPRPASMNALEFFVRSLALGCKMADGVFYLAADVSYGSTRSAFMSHAEDVNVTATIDKGGFPLCVLFIDVNRFTMRHMPRPYRMEGEDLAMYLDTYDGGWSTFTFNNLVFDDDRAIASTIPLSGDGEVDRTENLLAAELDYKVLGPYLKVTNRNPETGAVKRITVDWRRYHKDNGTHPTQVLTGDVVTFILGDDNYE